MFFDPEKGDVPETQSSLFSCNQCVVQGYMHDNNLIRTPQLFFSTLHLVSKFRYRFKNCLSEMSEFYREIESFKTLE